MKRTPGPWGWADISDNNKDPRIVIVKIPIPEDAKNCVIARIKNEVSGKPLTEEDKANAAFIVHACNLHDELVEALGGLLEAIYEAGIRANHDNSPIVKKANVVLAKANVPND